MRYIYRWCGDICAEPNDIRMPLRKSENFAIRNSTRPIPYREIVAFVNTLLGAVTRTIHHMILFGPDYIV